MRPVRLTMIIAAGAVALLATVAEIFGTPQALRVALGIPLVLLLPGYVTLCAVLPQRELSLAERALATLGGSMAISTCVSVLLAALPVGLSRVSGATTLGIGTAAVALYAWRRTRQFLVEQDDIRSLRHNQL